MSSSKDKGKRKLPMDQCTTQNYKLRFLKPVIRPSIFKLSLPITPDELPNRTPYLDLVVPDGRNNPFRSSTRRTKSIWTPCSISHTKENSNFQVRIFDFGGIENSYQLRDPEEPPYVRTGDYQIAKCINIPLSTSAKAVAAKIKSKWPFFVMDLTARMMSSRLLPNVPHLSHFTGQRHAIILTHGHIEVEATYTRYSGKKGRSLSTCNQRVIHNHKQSRSPHTFYIIILSPQPYHVRGGEYLSGVQVHIFIMDSG
ncbi:hypothetical protein S245_004766 [Arachis hypogaea]